jgi:AraC-like DNA-binding protein
MKVLQFTVPIIRRDSVVVEEDILPNFYNQLHRHKETQLTLILKGEGTLMVGNYAQPFKAGDIYMLGANQPHIFKSDSSHFISPDTCNAHSIHIFFDQERIFTNSINDLPEFEDIKSLLGNIFQGLQLPTENAPYVAEAIISLNKKSGLERLLSFIELLHYFSNQVKDWKSLSTGFSSVELTDHEGLRMNDIYKYTIEHYSEAISLDKIAAIAHITPHAFCKYFKKYTRKTYNTFLNEIRINEACKKIIKGDYDGISNIAYSTGFNSAINFNRVFKKNVGMSPSDYIRNYKFKAVYTRLAVLLIPLLNIILSVVDFD